MNFLRLIADTARDTVALWRLAIWIPLIAVIPEFLQHVAEINLGMFASREAFRELAAAPERMQWGYAKMAGLVIAWLLATWFWCRREGGPIDWRRLGLAVGLNAAVTAASIPLGQITGTAGLAVTIAFTIATIPLLVLLIGALCGDAAMTLAASYRSGWLVGLRIAVLTMLGFAVLQGIHQANHLLALGQPSWLVWALMVWDSLVVGLMACWLGTAMHRGYRGAVPRL